jgi:PPE-repeat protein
MAMTQAAAPYLGWLNATAAQAQQTATQAKAAASAYEWALAAMVPPPVIDANRAQRMSLVATNVLGQNSAAIAATEAHYEQMWAQDADAMYGYAAASATASRLNPFTSPPATTDPAGLAKQGAAVAQAAGNSVGAQAEEVMSNGSQLISTVPQVLQGLASSPEATSFSTALSSLSSTMSKLFSLDIPAKFAMHPLNFLNSALSLSKRAANAPAAATKAAESGVARGVGAGARALESAGLSGLGPLGSGAAMSAGMGRGVSIGALSAPPSWLTAPTESSVAAGLPSTSWHAPPLSEPAGVGPAGMPVIPLAGSAGRGVGGPAASRFELRSNVVPHSPAAG